MCKVGEINLSYECLTSPEVCQALVGLRTVNPSLHEHLSIPLPSASMPSSPRGHNGSYPEDQDDEDDNGPIDSSLSLDEVISWVADDAPGPLVDTSDDEDEGVDGFGHEISVGSAAVLEPFDPQFATSYWPRWDGNAIL